MLNKVAAPALQPDKRNIQILANLSRILLPIIHQRQPRRITGFLHAVNQRHENRRTLSTIIREWLAPRRISERPKSRCRRSQTLSSSALRYSLSHSPTSSFPRRCETAICPTRVTPRAFYKHLKGVRLRNRAATKQTAVQQLTPVSD